MKLLQDDYDQIFVWVDDFNEDDELSPRFDYKEDALLWKERIEKEIKK